MKCVKVWRGDLALPRAFSLPHDPISVSHQVSTNQKQVSTLSNSDDFYEDRVSLSQQSLGISTVVSMQLKASHTTYVAQRTVLVLLC